MSTKLRKIRKNNPELGNDPQILAIDQDVDRYAAIAAFNSSEGGLELRKALRSDVATAIQELTAKYGKADLPDMLVAVARIDARISLLQALGNAQTNRDDAEKLLDELTS